VNKLFRYTNGLTLLQLAVLILLGILSAYYSFIISIVWVFIVIATIYGFATKNSTLLWYGVAASPAMEIWARMSRASFVPHEIGKYYLLLVIPLLFYQHTKRTSNRPAYYVGSIMLFCLLPSIVVSTAFFDYEDWVLNGLGIIELATLLIFIARERWTVDQFAAIMKMSIIPIIPVVAYLSQKTPDLDKINFVLGSNFKTSGDFGGNQVSTVLGWGIIAIIILLQIKRPLIKIKWVNYVLIGVLLYRGFLTFSRGGVLVTALAVIILYLPVAFSSIKNALKFGVTISILSLSSIYLFDKVNTLTNNQLTLRYRGETMGTLSGTKERNLNTITSYRLQLAETDLMMFKDYWVWGVGVGRAKLERPHYGFQSIVSHTEFTRLLAEQGIGGLVAVILLSFFPIWWVYKQKYVIWKAVAASLFTVAILTSFHSAMRTNTTIVSYILAAVPVLYAGAKNENNE